MGEQNVIKKSALSPTALIVGGAGFIGSHLAEALLQKEARVVVVDNFSTGKDIYVHALLDNPKFALFNVDINQGLPKEIQSVDYIFYLAGLETYLFDKTDLNLDSLLTNAVGTKNILDFGHKCGAKILLASTIDVYRGMISPLSLDDYFGQTVEEEKRYSLAEAKRYAEALVWEYYRKHHADVRITRLPEIYGPRMNLGSSGNLGRLLRSTIEEKELVVYGEGTEKEHYLYISDAVSGLIKALFTDDTQGRIYTFVPKEEHTVLETAYLIKSLSAGEKEVVFKPKASGVATQEPQIPDKGSLEGLGWKERMPFKEGVLETLKWFSYEPNEHAFKPNKLIEQKKMESNVDNQGVMSISDEVGQPLPHVESKVEGDVQEKQEKQEKKASTGGFFKNLKFKPSTISLKRKPKKRTQKTPKLYQDSIEEQARRKKSRKIAIIFVYLLLALFVLFIFLGVPVLQTYVHALKGVNNLKQAQESLMSFDSASAKDSSNKAFKEFLSAQRSLDRVNWAFSVTGQEDKFNDIQGLFGSATYASKSVYFLSKGSQTFLAFWNSLKPTVDDTVEKEDFDNAQNSFVTAKENLELAQAELNQVNLGAFPEKIARYKTKFDDATELVDVLVVISSNVADLVGVEEKRSYLILFQNSNEVRPTGGFIGSYAIVEFENGKISSLTIDDIYNPDGQIDKREIQIEPPEVVGEYLSEDRLHIRNANWDPDFAATAEQIEELFFRLDGRRFDGVMAVDLYFVQNIMDATGPVFLAAYNEEVTSENLYERAQFHSEFNYEEGSDQKRAFLTVLGGKILERVFSFDNEELFGLAAALQKSMNEKHLLVYIPGNAINAYLNEKGWDGKLVGTESDYLYVVNSNLGGTKANYYVNNEMFYDINSVTRDGLLRAELTLNYDHTGQDYSWPGGPYTDYVRVLTQLGSKLTGAKLVFSDGTEEDVFEDVVISREGLYNSFELGFVLQPAQQVQLMFMYDLPEGLSVEKDTSEYNLYWQKQPGTNNDKIKFKFNSPFGVEIVDTDPEMDVGSNTAEYKGVLNSDIQFKLYLN